jgi:hypothetical protein
MLKTVPFGEFRTLKHWVFEFVSDFGFRISDLDRFGKVVPPRFTRQAEMLDFAVSFPWDFCYDVRLKKT